MDCQIECYKKRQPIVDALHDMGVKGVEMRGRNDIVVDDKKFSGMTMFKVGHSYAAGGTLMFDLSMDTASEVLTPEQDKLESKGVKSVNKRITNIKDYLDEPFRNMSADEFKIELLKRIFKADSLDDIETYTLNDHDWEVIDSRLEGKYDTDAWNYGENPGFTIYVSKHFDIGTVAFNFSLEDNKISSVKIYGDFITGGDISLIENALLGAEFDDAGLNAALAKVDLKVNLGHIEPQPLVDLLLSKIIRKKIDTIPQKRIGIYFFTLLYFQVVALTLVLNQLIMVVSVPPVCDCVPSKSLAG